MENKNSTKDITIKAVIVILVFLINEFFCIVYPIGIFGRTTLTFKKIHPSARDKACFSNQRVILGAIEMYNMDDSRPLGPEAVGWAPEDVLKLLVDGKYLKSIPTYGNTCKYEFFNNNGNIIPYCTYHGCWEFKNNPTVPGPAKEYEKESARIDREEQMKKYMPYLIYVGLVFVVIFL